MEGNKLTWFVEKKIVAPFHTTAWLIFHPNKLEQITIDFSSKNVLAYSLPTAAMSGIKSLLSTRSRKVLWYSR